MLMFGLRLGPDPRVVVTTTPKPVKIIRELLADPTTVVTRGSNYENRACDMAAGEAATCLGKLTALRSYRACLRAIERHQNSTKRRGNVTRPRAADDFATIRARLEELRQERERAETGEKAIASAPERARVSRVGQVLIAAGRLRGSAGSWSI